MECVVLPANHSKLSAEEVLALRSSSETLVTALLTCACWVLRSVVGLSFDYIMYNIQGFLFYSTYTIVNYIEQHRLGLTHSVQPNDIAFGLHAVIMTVVNIVQCVIYEV